MRIRVGPLTMPLAALIALLSVSAGPEGRAAPRPQAGADYYDAAVRHLRLAVTAQPDGSHLGRLLSLRQLETFAGSMRAPLELLGGAANA